MCKMLNENGITPRKSQIEEEEEDEEEEKTLRVYTLHSKIENYAMRVNNTVSAIHIPIALAARAQGGTVVADGLTASRQQTAGGRRQAVVNRSIRST